MAYTKGKVIDIILKNRYGYTMSDFNGRSISEMDHIFSKDDGNDSKMEQLEKEIITTSKRIRNFMGYVEDENHPLHWFANDYITDECMAEIVSVHLSYIEDKMFDKDTAERLVLDQMSKRGSEYDYSYWKINSDKGQEKTKKYELVNIT